MDTNDENSSTIPNSAPNSSKSSLKILEEIDKAPVQDVPPNFNSYIYFRIHDDPEGKLHG